MRFAALVALGCVLIAWQLGAQPPRSQSRIGQERAIPRHLQDGEEFKLPLADLVTFGRQLFEANWTDQDGGGRPLTKGSGEGLSDPKRPLTGARAFNRISGPDANSCQGCHNAPFGITGGNGDVVTNMFELADRFDFVTFDRADSKVTGGTLDEKKQPVSLQTVGNARSTPGLFGAGYVEMVARQITDDLQRIRDSMQPGQSKPLVAKGIAFGSLARRANGRLDVSAVEGLSERSLAAAAAAKPSLIVRPWTRSGHAVSLREFTNDAYNRSLGIQTTERFGRGTDPDGDGVVNEMTRADVTAVTIFQATLAVPGRVIPNDSATERAVLTGEHLFEQMRCTVCHLPSMALDRRGWIYSEPGPYNPPGNLRRGEARSLSVDLTDSSLPSPRLAPSAADPNVIQVRMYSDFKLHDIGGPESGGKDRFLTLRLW